MPDRSLPESFAAVIEWHEKKRREVRDIRLRYDLWGFPLIGIHWHDRKGKPHDFYQGATRPDILKEFEKKLKRYPPTKNLCHI